MHHTSHCASSKVAAADKALNCEGHSDESGGAAIDGPAAAASMASTSVSITEINAVVFSIQFYGKTIGEVGLMDQDLSQLDWQRFKTYIFQNLLSMNNQENISITYSDDEGDKLPIESEEEYREALKVAKKKAEVHDKLVLDLTRQGGFPTVFSFVSSGIKRVSSSPPKDGRISFFKSASHSKDTSGFMTRSSAPDRRIFPSLFSSDRGDGEVPGEVARPEKHGRNFEQPPEWFTTYMDKFREEMCEDLITKLAHMVKEECLISSLPDKKNPNHNLSQAESKESGLSWRSLRPESESDTVKHYSEASQIQMNHPIVCNNFLAERVPPRDITIVPLECEKPLRRQRKSSKLEERRGFQISFTGNPSGSQENSSGTECLLTKNETGLKEDITNADRDKEVKLNTIEKRGSFQCGFTELSNISKEDTTDGGNHLKKKDWDGKENINTDVGMKRKKLVREEERLTKWLEKVEEKMARKQGKMEERFIKKHEKLEERFVKKQEKLVERFQKHQEKAEKRKPSSNRPLDVEKSIRAQGKLLAKMEGMRKKQACSVEELSKLRKVVDKHHKATDKHHEGKAVDLQQLRRSDRKAGSLKPGKTRKIDIDAKAYPVDSSLLQKALMELESIAEVSPVQRQTSAILGFDAFYVRDITYPDGSLVPCDAKFVKTWRVLNSGMMPWNEKTELCKWSQVQLQGSPVGWKLRPTEKKVVCPPLRPGECGNVSITFTAPSEPGWYATHWRFCHQGYVFGNQIWCAVHVGHKSDIPCDNKADSEIIAQANIPEDSEKKVSPETAKSNEESSPSGEDIPVIVDAAKDTRKMENSTATLGIGLTSDSLHELKVESATLREQALQSSEYEVGIIENYYDAEDPAEENTQTPLKDIAKEPVDSLGDLMKEISGDEDIGSCSVSSEPFGLDDLSISSESFSDLDSEDQAILNESDSDISDQDYFVVNMPECFDMKQPYLDNRSNNGASASRETKKFAETERHDSPDFLTADEDDRTAAAIHYDGRHQDESMGRKLSSKEDNEGTNSTGIVLDVSQSFETENEKPHSDKNPKTEEGNIRLPSLLHHAIGTSGFMETPPEALQTNLAQHLLKESEVKSEAEQQHPQELGQGNWCSGKEGRQSVVCEQPVSTQVGS